MTLHRILLYVFFSFSLSLSATEVLEGSAAYQAIKGTQVLRFRAHTDIPVYIEFNRSERIQVSQWQTWMQSQFFADQSNVTFVQIGTESDRLGMEHLRFQQLVDGRPVSFSFWIVHTLDGEVVSMNGTLFSHVTVPQPVLQESNALTIALNHVNAEIYAWEVDEEEAVLHYLHDDENATYFPKGSLEIITPDISFREIEHHLAWKFDIYAHTPMSRREIYVDALSGEVLFENDRIHHADSNGIALTGYSGERAITTDWAGSQFRLQESGRGNGIRTFDLNNGTSGLGSDFTHPDNYWDNTSVERFGTDAHWGAEMTYDYFFNHFNRNSINNNGFALISRVHYGVNYANAFWNGSFMTYGDGSSGNAPFTALDIAGHEIAHGLTNFTANLVYQNEPGALNESFSDIFGAAIEFDALGVQDGDWLIGEDLGFIIRSMSNPNSQNNPDTYHGLYWYYGPGDNGGVHYNSGVQNHWFYLLTAGGSGTNDIGNTFSVTGVGLEAAGAIAYRNLVTYLGVSSDYEDARFYAIRSAYDLYGPCSQEATSTANAWYAVGIGTPFETSVTADFIPSSTGNCAVPHPVQFINTSSHATSFSWQFGDGGTSTLMNPTRTYSNAGVYTVTLIASSVCGIDTIVMPDLIEIGPNAPCEVIMPESGTLPTLTQCSGNLYDQGGATGNYENDMDSYIVIHHQGSASITLTFEQFNVQPGGGTNCIYDFLEVYDGNGLNAPLLGKYCNSNLPPAQLTSTSDKITVRFVTNNGFTYPGFKIRWDCDAPTSPPAAAFMADVIQTCDGLVQFQDQSMNGTDTWFWNFGDGATSTNQNPVHSYNASGSYTVTLVSTNSIGSDTVVESSFITVNLAEIPVAPDDDICPGEFGELIATSNGEHRWYTSPLSNIPILVGDTLITPVVQQSTAYYVESAVQSSARSAGPVANQFGFGGYLGSPQVMFFDAYSEAILESVKVYALTAGNRTFQLINAAGQVVADTVVFVAAGEQTVPLEFHITPGTNQSIGIGGDNMINLYRNSAGADYPYELDGVLSIVKSGGSAPLEAYHYFYDWQVRKICVSERKEVAASVGICTGIEQISASSYRVYPNPSIDIVHIESLSNEPIIGVSLQNVHGQAVLTSSSSTGSAVQLDLSHLASGVYILKFTQKGKLFSERIVIQ